MINHFKDSYNTSSPKNKIFLIYNFVYLCIITTFWFLPIFNSFFQYLDQKIFFLLNKSLSLSFVWQQFWGMLNHPVENWANLLIMFGINILAIILTKKGKRKKALYLTLYFWLFYQLTIIGTNIIFSKTLNIHRESPTVILKPFIMLSEALGNKEIKDASENCFPAGHAMVAIYWFYFINLLQIKKLRILTIIVATFLSISRVVSGAHWASDIIFTFFYAKVWFFLANYCREQMGEKIKFKNHYKITEVN